MRRVLSAAAEVALVFSVLGVLVVLLGVAFMPVRVGGMSMHPALHVGDLVVVRKGVRPTVGQIALVRAPGHGLVLHRVVRQAEDGGLVTRGDANAVDDREKVVPSSVAGTVLVVLAFGRVAERWRERGAVRYHGGSTEHAKAMTETALDRHPIDQGRAP